MNGRILLPLHPNAHMPNLRQGGFQLLQVVKFNRTQRCLTKCVALHHCQAAITSTFCEERLYCWPQLNKPRNHRKRTIPPCILVHHQSKWPIPPAVQFLHCGHVPSSDWELAQPQRLSVTRHRSLRSRCCLTLLRCHRRDLSMLPQHFKLLIVEPPR